MGKIKLSNEWISDWLNETVRLLGEKKTKDKKTKDKKRRAVIHIGRIKLFKS